MRRGGTCGRVGGIRGSQGLLSHVRLQILNSLDKNYIRFSFYFKF
jgi:hypothetical protein